MKRRLIMLGALFALAGAQAAQAQVLVDIAKITCRQLLFDKTFSPKTKSIALWLSGYYNGKKGNTVVDVGALATQTEKVEDYCRLNQETTLMDAVGKALGPPAGGK